MSPMRCTLLVDDAPTTNYLNLKLLNRLVVSVQVQVASNGQEALAVLTASCSTPNAPACPALIFLDVNMPVMNGFEFLDAYQQLPLAQQNAVVIIMLISSLHPRNVQRADSLPVAGFLTKPLTAEKVIRIVDDYFPAT
jgi:CheY-like chemotaxis protein